MSKRRRRTCSSRATTGARDGASQGAPRKREGHTGIYSAARTGVHSHESMAAAWRGRLAIRTSSRSRREPLIGSGSGSRSHAACVPSTGTPGERAGERGAPCRAASGERLAARALVLAPPTLDALRSRLAPCSAVQLASGWPRSCHGETRAQGAAQRLRTHLGPWPERSAPLR